MTVVTALTVAAPGATDLAITEVLADPPDTIAGDYNCDGVRDGTADEFFEVKNISNHAVALVGLGVWDDANFVGAGTATTPRATFGTELLGPGEMMAVFAGGSPLADTLAGPWCDSLDTSDGDVIALNALLSFNNDGDTVRLTATNDRSSTLLATFVYGATADMSLVRDPAPLGQVVPYATAAGALLDRVASPSTNTDGSDQAEVP